MTEIYITGIGVVSPFGLGTKKFWDGLCHRVSEPTSIPELDTVSMPVRHVYRVPESANMRTAVEFATAAAAEALSDAGCQSHDLTNFGVTIGNAMGDHGFERAAEPNKAEPVPFSTSAVVSQHFGACGPSINVSTACSAGLYSLGLAMDLIRSGHVDGMIVGGAEAISRVALGCFNRLSALDSVCCRPFDQHRQGTVMGEGAAIFILESRESMDRRKWQRAYGRVKGTGWSCDAFHLTNPEPSGEAAFRAAWIALEESRIQAEDIGCVLAHGTGTEQNDVVEARVIARVLGSQSENVPVCGIKGKLGHSGGASGAFQCVTAALILESGVIPPTANLSTMDERIALKLSTQSISSPGVDNILLNSYAFGGNNSSVIIGT